MEVKIRKVQESNEYFTFWFEGADDETTLEILRSRFRGMKRPKEGDILKMLQMTIEGKTTTSMSINGKIIV